MADNFEEFYDDYCIKHPQPEMESPVKFGRIVVWSLAAVAFFALVFSGVHVTPVVAEGINSELLGVKLFAAISGFISVNLGGEILALFLGFYFHYRASAFRSLRILRIKLDAGDQVDVSETITLRSWPLWFTGIFTVLTSMVLNVVANAEGFSSLPNNNLKLFAASLLGILTPILSAVYGENLARTLTFNQVSDRFAALQHKSNLNIHREKAVRKFERKPRKPSKRQVGAPSVQVEGLNEAQILQARTRIFGELQLEDLNSKARRLKLVEYGLEFGWPDVTGKALAQIVDISPASVSTAKKEVLGG